MHFFLRKRPSPFMPPILLLLRHPAQQDVCHRSKLHIEIHDLVEAQHSCNACVGQFASGSSQCMPKDSHVSELQSTNLLFTPHPHASPITCTSPITRTLSVPHLHQPCSPSQRNFQGSGKGTKFPGVCLQLPTTWQPPGL